MKVRDLFAEINGDDSVIEMPSGGLEIVGEDGRSMFSMRLTKDGVLELSGGNLCRHGGKLLDERISVEPRASNLIYIRKSECRISGK